MCNDRGPDVSIECAAGEYAKGWAHYFEMMLGLETDTSEIVNEMIASTRNFGSCGITGVYVGFVSSPCFPVSSLYILTSSQTNHFNIGSLMERGIRLIGNGQAPVHKYWESLLKMIQDKQITPMKMVTHRVRLEDLAAVYHAFDKKEDGMQKVFVETKYSFPPCEGSPELKRF
jgi:threonine dehydrogenase-like Zn-dependent dehydrogenase